MPAFQSLAAALFANNALSSLLLHTSPNAAVLVATAGLCLIAFELNRPGLILPGSLGLVLVLLAAAVLGQHPLRPVALCLLGGAAGVLACNLWKKVPLGLLISAGLALAVGLRMLVRAPHHEEVSPYLAVGCGVTLSLLAALLSRIALRARRLKAVH